MLVRLSVKNLAIVESATVEFGPGLNIITGETGAGKSVLMGALELVLGARADASTVRDGAPEARIEAEFRLADSSIADAVLSDADLPVCEDGTLILRRSVSASGGGRVRINDASSTVQTLRALGRALVDLHGPNDHQSLLEESFQRSVLDSYGGVAHTDYSAAWKAHSEASEMLAALNGDTSDVAAECDTLRFIIKEIDDAALTQDDGDDLAARHAAAAHAAEIIECGNAAMSGLSGDESAVAALIAVGRQLSVMAKFHAPAEEWRREVESATVGMQELSSAISDSLSRLDADPDALALLDERLSLVQKLKRKYGPTVDAILELRDAKAARLNDLEGRGEKIKELTANLKSAEAAVRKAGAALTASRRKAADMLAKAVTRELHGLGFLRAGFSVHLLPSEPSASGCDTVDFYFEPNPGEKERPLREIASSGEIARVMLAVKAVLAGHDSIPILVFDEIDSNIGGEVGHAVGEKLHAVSKHHQVIAITHLPQSAVSGDRHLVVSKSVSGGRTRTSIHEVSGEERIAEIARMLGGANQTSVVMAHAKELLSLSRKKRVSSSR